VLRILFVKGLQFTILEMWYSSTVNIRHVCLIQILVICFNWTHVFDCCVIRLDINSNKTFVEKRLDYIYSKLVHHCKLNSRHYFISIILEHKRRLTTWLVLFCQVEGWCHNRELNCQPLCSVWIPLHYHLIV
jgi:hypothetical protein